METVLQDSNMIFLNHLTTDQTQNQKLQDWSSKYVKKISFIVDTWKDCLCYFTTKHFHHAHNLLLPTTHHHHHQENHQMHLNAVDNFITPAYNLPEAANILSEADHISSWLCLKWFDLILSWPISFLSRQQTYPPWANTVPILHTPPPNYQWKSTEHLSSPW